MRKLFHYLAVQNTKILNIKILNYTPGITEHVPWDGDRDNGYQRGDVHSECNRVCGSLCQS